MSRTADAIIIGAGVIGAAVAFEMAKKGFKTLNIDANGEAGHGSTAASCAVIRVHYSTLEGTALAYEAYHYWRNWGEYLEIRDERGLAEFLELGCLVMKTDQNDHMKKQTQICEQLGVVYEDWDEAAIRARLPGCRLDRFSPAKRPEDVGFGEPTGGKLEGAIFFPNAGYVNDPALSTHNLQRAAEAKGAEFLFNSTVTEILRTATGTTGVRLASGEKLSSPVVINVAGPASNKINQMADVTGDMSIRTQAMKQEVVHVPMPEGYFADGSKFLISDSDTFLYCRPEKSDHLLIGSEDPSCDDHVWVDDPEGDDWRDFTEQSRIQAMRMAQRVPTIGIPNYPRGVVGLYDVADDWIPIYDRSSLPGFYMACGTSGNQYKNAPMAGKMMAALVEYCEGGNDHDSRPLTIRMPYTGIDLDIGFFSRKRPVNQDSSFSVLG